MTNAQLDESFDVIFAGGPLLPPRDGGCSLTDVAKSSSRNHNISPVLVRERAGRHPGFTPRKYSHETRAAVRAMRAEGWTCQRIATKFQLPHGTVYGWVQDRNGR